LELVEKQKQNTTAREMAERDGAAREKALANVQALVHQQRTKMHRERHEFVVESKNKQALVEVWEDDHDGRLINKWPAIIHAKAAQIEQAAEDIGRETQKLQRIVEGYAQNFGKTPTMESSPANPTGMEQSAPSQESQQGSMSRHPPHQAAAGASVSESSTAATPHPDKIDMPVTAIHAKTPANSPQELGAVPGACPEVVVGMA
jgi:hypothetical protein